MAVQKDRQHRYSLANPRPCPDDFEDTFIRIGRSACTEHYRVGRLQVDHWLAQCEKERLIAARAEFVRSTAGSGRRPCPPDFDIAYVRLGPTACERRYDATGRTIRRWVEERGKEQLTAARNAEVGKGLTPRDIGLILSQAFPARSRNTVSLTLARHAAQYLRQMRHGGHIISPAPDGQWWVGARKRSARELVDLAKSKGFDPSLHGERG